MNQLPTYSYDKEADVLYISFSPGEKATTAVELNDKISIYTPFAAEAVPITSIAKPPFAIAA